MERKQDMKTFPALYIDPNGTLKAGEFPEEPRCCSLAIQEECENKDVWVESLHKLTCVCRSKEALYEQALQAAKDSAVEVENKEQVQAAIMIECLPKDTVHPLPDGWGIEVKNEVDQRFSDADIEQGCVPCGEVFSSIRKVAVLVDKCSFPPESNLSEIERYKRIANNQREKIRECEEAAKATELESDNNKMRLAIVNHLVRIGELEKDVAQMDKEIADWFLAVSERDERIEELQNQIEKWREYCQRNGLEGL